MTEHETPDHEATCLMCAVRALTEGDPAVTWNPAMNAIGETISGVVLRIGEKENVFGPIPFVDLWRGGTGRVRVMAWSGTLRYELTSAAPQVGDRLSVKYVGEDTVRDGRMAGKTYRKFAVTVQRGH